MRKALSRRNINLKLPELVLSERIAIAPAIGPLAMELLQSSSRNGHLEME